MRNISKLFWKTLQRLTLLYFLIMNIIVPAARMVYPGSTLEIESMKDRQVLLGYMDSRDFYVDSSDTGFASKNFIIGSNPFRTDLDKSVYFLRY